MKFVWKNFPENPLSHDPISKIVIPLVVRKLILKNYPEMLLTHDPKSEILKKTWKNFPRNPLSDHPVFGNIFQDLAIWVKI